MGTGGIEDGGEAGTGGAQECPNSGGPTMVKLPAGYCIDSTEVTQAQYQTWLNASPPTSNQISVCSWNTTFLPSSGWPPASSTLNNPVAYVDWCDAYAYCAGTGKRLCGKIGGGSNGYTDYVNATLSQWYAACTSNGTYSSNGYPYGNTYQPTYCNGRNAGNGGPVAVGTMPDCQSPIPGYGGVYDLSGDLYEWEDSCDGTVGQSDHCRIRGGAFGGNIGTCDPLACGCGVGNSRTGTSNLIGFRCCSP